MRTKKCKKCGKLFETEKSEAYLCPECATIARKTGVYRERVCIDCGATFWGYPKSKRCPGCREAVNLARKRDYNKHGPKRGLGSVDKCEVCGKEYVVESGLQRYCKECASAAVLDNTRQHKREYNASNPEIIGKARELRRGNNVCVVCGGMIPAGSGSNTCSPECWAEQKRRVQQRAQRRAAMLAKLELDETTDTDIIARLSEVDDVVNYIKTAIRRDIGRPPGKPRSCAICGAEFEGRTNAKYCPACRSNHAYNQQYYQAHKDDYAAYAKKYAQTHRAELNERSKKYYHDNLEAMRAAARKSYAKRREAKKELAQKQD